MSEDEIKYINNRLALLAGLLLVVKLFNFTYLLLQKTPLMQTAFDNIPEW